ncbi:MAG TPA: SH3 domain-containing protein [Devosia sp.]
MRRSRFGFGTAAFALAGVVGAMMLIPGDPSSEAVATAPQVQTALTSPELTRFLDNALDTSPEAKTSEEVIAAVASAPDATPSAPRVQVAATSPTSPVQGLGLPETADMTVTGSVTASDETLRARTAVNMRSGPSTSYGTLTVLQPDEPVTVLERDGGWARIQKNDGATGWVYGSYLGDGSAIAAAPVRSPEPVREASVTAREVEAEQVRTSRFSLREPRKETRRNDDNQLAAIRLRASPSSGSETIMIVEAGTPLRIAEKRRGWARVVIPGGISGWVRTN